jgi:hopanoid C-3 methylase HpnR
MIDLQVESHAAYHRLVREWRPDFIAFSCNYLANVPEIVDLSKASKAELPRCFVCVGGHSASFTARAMLEHGQGAIDCVLKGEGEAAILPLLEAVESDRSGLGAVPGAVTLAGEGAPPRFVHSLDELMPARDLLRHRRKYFIGVLDPCASIEFSRGCPWDCSFCSAWTFYGRSYRLVSPERVVEDLESIKEPGVFIVDDVAFIQEKHGLAIGEAIARKGIKKNYYLETRGDVLLRNKEVFKFWKTLGVSYMFLGLEAIDEEGLKKYRKRVSLGRNFEALEFARSLGIEVAINLIADPDWDEARFATVRQWCLEVPEIVNISVNTPYPGTESWLTDGRRLATRDYRLFDIQHAVLPTRLPLDRFYRELVDTQRVLFQKHMNWRNMRGAASRALGHLMRGQTNFLMSLFKFNSVYNVETLLKDHELPVRYQIPEPPAAQAAAKANARAADLYIHPPRGRAGRATDDAMERFVDETRMGAAQ